MERLAKRVIRATTPPILLKPFDAYRAARKPSTAAADEDGAPTEPFDGEGDMFLEHVATSSNYAEYGAGRSTIYALRNTNASVVSVETSREWAGRILEEAAQDDRLRVHLVDLGAVGAWGRPLDYRRRAEIPNYLGAPFRDGFSPDMVLIDGRFRVASFLTTLLRSQPGTRVVFDDYVRRPWYHVIEEVLPPARVHGRQALFIVPTKLDRNQIQALIESFLLVMD